MATNTELRSLVVSKAKSREKKNSYNDGAKRTQVASGFSDCSSLVRWCYLQVIGKDIGLNTAAQIVKSNVLIVDKTAKCPREANLRPGDLLYFRGSDKSRPLGVGHVEMYIGNGKIIGHGSGIGPTIKDMKAYCTTRYNANRAYIRAHRIIGSNFYPGDTTPAKLGDYVLSEGMYNSNVVKEFQTLLTECGYKELMAPDYADGDFGPKTKKAVKAFQRDHSLAETGIADLVTIAAVQMAARGEEVVLSQKVRIVGGTCYVRTGPSTDGKIVGTVGSGKILDSTGGAENGWNGVFFSVNGTRTACWVSGKYSEVV